MSAVKERLTIPLGSVIDDSLGVEWGRNLPYHKMYQAYLQWFAGLIHIGQYEVIIGASMVYAWMPRQLTIGFDSLPSAATALEAVRHGADPSPAELDPVVATINRSIVGASKFLHFLAPLRFAIADSNVAAYLRQHEQRDPRDGPKEYLEYCAACREAVADARFEEVQRRANQELGFPVPPLRALELVTYLAGSGRHAS